MITAARLPESESPRAYSSAVFSLITISALVCSPSRVTGYPGTVYCLSVQSRRACVITSTPFMNPSLEQGRSQCNLCTWYVPALDQVLLMQVPVHASRGFFVIVLRKVGQIR